MEKDNVEFLNVGNMVSIFNMSTNKDETIDSSKISIIPKLIESSSYLSGISITESALTNKNIKAAFDRLKKMWNNCGNKR